MKQISVFITLWVTVLFLSACGGKSSTVSGSAQGDSIPLHYSSNLSLIDYEDYIVAQLRNPWDTTKILHTYVLVDKSSRYPKNYLKVLLSAPHLVKQSSTHPFIAAC